MGNAPGGERPVTHHPSIENICWLAQLVDDNINCSRGYGQVSARVMWGMDGYNTGHGRVREQPALTESKCDSQSGVLGLDVSLSRLDAAALHLVISQGRVVELVTVGWSVYCDVPNRQGVAVDSTPTPPSAELPEH